MSFLKLLSSGKFVVLAEINTPKGVDISDMLAHARSIKGRVDMAVIPDMDNGVMRLSAIAGGAMIHQQGIETAIHLYARDKNRMALQSDILAAYVLGIKNLIVVQGETTERCDHHDTKAVDDIDEIELIRIISRLMSGKDMADFDLSGQPSFTVGCTISPFSDESELEKELSLIRQKIDAGVQFLITPPIFDVSHLNSLMEHLKRFSVPVIATVFLLKSVGVARYMSVNIPGIRIPEEIIRRIRQAGDRENECLRIAGEMIKDFRQISHGVKIETVGWELKLPQIMDYAGL